MANGKGKWFEAVGGAKPADPQPQEVRAQTTKPTRLSDSEVNRIAWAISKGEASRREARLFIVHFCRLVQQNRPMPGVMLECLRGAFVKALTGAASSDVALGLARGPGRPRGKEDERWKMAAAMVKSRFEGLTYEDSVTRVAADFDSGATAVKDAFQKYAQSAVWSFHQDHPDLSKAEIERLSKILPKRSGKLPDITPD
jgi:hypothetical protein